MITRTLAAAAIATSLLVPSANAATVGNGHHADRGQSVYALKTVKTHHMTAKHRNRHHVACKQGSKLKYGKCHRTMARK